MCELVPKYGGSLNCFRWVVSLLGQRSTLRNLFLLLLLLLDSIELSFPSCCGVCAQKLQEQEDCSCTSDLVDHSHDHVVALKWVWSSTPLSAGSWGQEQVLVFQICVERTCDVQNRNSISAVSAASTE